MSPAQPPDYLGHTAQPGYEESPSVLALSSVLLEVSSLQGHNLDDGVREALEEVEAILLEKIAMYATAAASSMSAEDQED